MTPPEALVAVDVGTSALRAALVSPSGDLLALVRSRTPRLEGARPGLDGEALWTELAALLRSLPTGVRLRGVAVAAQLGLALVDAAGRPVGPVMPWDDQRATREGAALAAELGRDALTMCGRPVSPELSAPKLAWARAHEPRFGEARHALSLKDYLVFRLTGEPVTDETHASYTLLYDVTRREWSPRLLSVAGVDPVLLPPALPATAQAGRVTVAAARETGLPAGLLVAVGGPDGTLGAVGAGAVEPGVTVDIAGTTDVLVHTVRASQTDPSGRAIVNAHVVPGLWTLGGPTGMTGGAIAWLARLLGFDGVDELYAAVGADIERGVPGAHGLVFRTALTGERFPHWHVDSSGRLVGLAPHHTCAHLVQAAEEGAAFLVREGLDALQRLGVEIEEVLVVGGVAKNPDLLALRAAAWARRVVTVGRGESTLAGAAMAAGVASGVFADLAEAASVFVRERRGFEPDRRLVALLEPAYTRWRAAG